MQLIMLARFFLSSLNGPASSWLDTQAIHPLRLNAVQRISILNLSLRSSFSAFSDSQALQSAVLFPPA